MLATDDESIRSHDVATALERLLTEYGNLTLSADTIAIQKARHRRDRPLPGTGRELLCGRDSGHPVGAGEVPDKAMRAGSARARGPLPRRRHAARHDDHGAAAIRHVRPRRSSDVRRDSGESPDLRPIVPAGLSRGPSLSDPWRRNPRVRAAPKLRSGVSGMSPPFASISRVGHPEPSRGNPASSVRRDVVCERFATTETARTSDGRTPNCARNRLLKWDELPNPMEYAISVIHRVACSGEDSRSWHRCSRRSRSHSEMDMSVSRNS